MELKRIIEVQREFDTDHGWTPEDTLNAKVQMVNKDLIGLLGEIGEFANVIKKINLELDRNNINAAESVYEKYQENLTEEVVDTFIYLLRIASHLDVNITEGYLKKLAYNGARYKNYETNNR